MADLQVTCINKPDRNSSHEHITHLGGPGLPTAGIGKWRWTTQQVINYINNDTHTFYTLDGRKRADVKVRKGSHGDYVQTQADGDWTNNLLAQETCQV